MTIKSLLVRFTLIAAAGLFSPFAGASVPTDNEVKQVVNYALYLSDVGAFPEEKLVLDAAPKPTGRNIAESEPDLFEETGVAPSDLADGSEFSHLLLSK